MGLGKEYWHDVINVLRDIIPVYDKVNLAISLGKAKELREKGIQLLLNDNMFVLDAGSGYGNMTETLLNLKQDAKIIMLDPIPEMLMIAKERFANIPKISGVFEHIPFDDNTFTSIMCGYSFRDAISYSKAIEEFARVLKDDGRLVIVDIGKPDNILFRLGVGFYLRFLMPLLAFLVAGRLGLKFKEIYGTWKSLPKNKDMIKLLETKFRRVEMHSMLFGGAVIFIAYK